MAVGLDKARGDEIVVHAVAMADTGAPQSGSVQAANSGQYQLQNQGQSDEEVEKILQSMGMSMGNSSVVGLEGDVDEKQINADAAPASVTQKITEYYQQLKTQLQNGDIVVLGIVIITALLFIFSIIWILLAKLTRTDNTLSYDEREQLLRQLNTWLEPDSNLVEDGKV